jgi:uncharacterized membrane protein YfcA
MLLALLIPIMLAALVYCGLLVRTAISRQSAPRAEAIALGAVTNFFDTLGIGSFAPTMAWFKFRRMVDDRLIPCTMLVGYTPPTMVQAIIFLMILGLLVDPVLLAGCILALVTGAVVGAPIAAKARVWVVQSVVAIALVIAGALYAMTNLDLTPGGGTASGLPPGLMILAITANFIFGALLNFGIGNYAPTLVMLSLMGMDPRLCFPIMAGGGALAAAGASVRHINYGKVDLRIAGGLALGGIPAVFVAAFIVKAMPITLLRWLVVVVVLYAAVVMLREATAGRRRPASLLEDRAEAL